MSRDPTIDCIIEIIRNHVILREGCEEYLALCKDLHEEPDESILVNMAPKSEINKLILSFEIPRAMDIIRKVYPAFNESYPDLFFELCTVHALGVARNESDVHAIRFLQDCQHLISNEFSNKLNAIISGIICGSNTNDCDTDINILADKVRNALVNQGQSDRLWTKFEGKAQNQGSNVSGDYILEQELSPISKLNAEYFALENNRGLGMFQKHLIRPKNDPLLCSNNIKSIEQNTFQKVPLTKTLIEKLILHNDDMNINLIIYEKTNKQNYGS